MLEISYIISRSSEDMEQTDDSDLEYIGYPPENLSDLPESLLSLLKEVGEYTLRRKGYDLAKICSALEKNGEEILADIKSADWTYDTEGHGEANLFTWFWNLSGSIAQKENTHIANPVRGILPMMTGIKQTRKEPHPGIEMRNMP